MEIIEWAVQFKSHATLTLSQQVVLGVANNLLAIYLMAFLFIRSKDIAIAFCATIACVFVSYSSTYELVNGWQLMLLYCFCYSMAYQFLTGAKTRFSCAIMILFTAIMAVDAWTNATVETWLYNHYASTVTCIHCVIIASCVRWRRTK